MKSTDRLVHRQVEILTLTLVFRLGKLPSILSLQWLLNKICAKKKMIRQSRAEKVLGRVDRGVHLLQKGIAIGQGIYQIGKTLAPLAAVAMA